MAKTPAELPDTIENLRALVVLQQENHEVELSERNDEITQLREYIRPLKSQRFGSSSERSPSSQMGLFNEAEVLCDEDEGGGQADGDASPIEVPAHTRRKRGGRKPLPAFLPREEILHDLSEEEKICCNDAGHRLTQIGIDRLEQLVFVPASAKVLVHLRPKYACSSCKDGVKSAPPPISPIPKSFATPSLLAQIVTSKYVDALPLYRQAKIYERMGVDLNRATMASWVMKMGELVTPLLGIMLKEIRSGDYVQMDETPFQVLKEKGKLATTNSYLWALRGGEAERPLLYYEYAPTRGAEVAKGLLEGFEGYLQTDGYKGYDGFEESAGVIHVGCFAHARRKFDEALRGQGKKANVGKKVGKKASLARQGLGRISELYKIERDRTVGVSESRVREAARSQQPGRHRSAAAVAHRDQRSPGARRHPLTPVPPPKEPRNRSDFRPTAIENLRMGCLSAYARTTKTPHKVSRNKSGTPIVRASKLFRGRPKRTTRETVFEAEQQAQSFADALNLAALRDGDWRRLKGEDWIAHRRYVDDVLRVAQERTALKQADDTSSPNVNVGRGIFAHL